MYMYVYMYAYMDTCRYEHFYIELEEFVHYIPVAEDLSDVVEKLHWARNHDRCVYVCFFMNMCSCLCVCVCVYGYLCTCLCVNMYLGKCVCMSICIADWCECIHEHSSCH